jgi:hypothetical protein
VHEFDNERRQLNEIIETLREQLEGEKEQRALLYAIVQELREELKLLRHINREVEEIEEQVKPSLSFIRIAIGGTMPVGPATLAIGQTATATVLGFDQNGAPIAIDFTANPVTWADDNEASVQDAPTTSSDGLTALAAGVANLTATCAGFKDTETVTVLAATPVLSSIKVSID